MSSGVRTTGPAEQAEVIAFLGDAATHGVGAVERFETHGNLVFLAGQDAWKIKRAVAFAYMDFSTLEKRRVACAREVEVNRRLAPDIYLGCVGITREPDGRLALGGSGEAVEWAVHMRRFDQSALLGNIAAAQGIGPELARAVADAVLESHRGAAVAGPADGAGKIGQLATSLAESHGAPEGVRCCRRRWLRTRGPIAAHPRRGNSRRARALAAACAAATATCTSATSCCGAAGPCCSMPSSSTRPSPPSTRSTIWPFC